MENRFRSNVEFVTQIVVAVAVVMVAGVIIKRHLLPQPLSPPRASRISVGERLNLPDVDWSKNGRSLVVFLNKDCRFCTSSAPFYKQLMEVASQRNVKSLAVFPNSLEEAKAYLKSVSLSIDDVRTGPLSSFKIDGTPAAVVVNKQGIVEKIWFGDTSSREELILREFLIVVEVPD